MAVTLNDKQHEAVNATEGPVLVIAGAGSGKTRVLTERIAHLVRDRRVDPWHILAFTFTNRAAREMKERLEATIPGAFDKMWVGTFHSTGVRILRRHGKSIGIKRDFTIYDAGDSLDLVKDCVARGGGILKSPRAVRDQISRWKNDLVTPAEAASLAGNNIERKIAIVYKAYEAGLRRASALDFDDLISKVVELFTSDDEARLHYANRFRYILVDEFQDTNPIQMALIDALASVHQNLFAVGDDDQSIYSWRGARVEHILNFEGLYPDTRVIRLEQNYRSSQTILDAANNVIANNAGRMGKNLWTEGDRGESIGLIVSTDEESEAMNILQTVTALSGEGYSLKDIAILYRTNAQSRALEDVLKLGSTPYQIIGSVRFYERAEIRDLLAYCKLLVNPDDDISLKRILNVPKRGLGKSTWDALSSLAASRNVSVMEVLRSGSFDLAAAQIRRCRDFIHLFEILHQAASTEDAPAVITRIVGETGYRRYLEAAYPDAESRNENVDELVTAAEVYTENSEDRSLRAFLEEIALVADIDSFDEGTGQLTLMTLHNAKGLEFDCVIIAGLEEGLCPHFNSLDSSHAVEEERRLFYVGMTRARKRLFCSWAQMRRRMGVIEGSIPSRFLGEVPEALIDGTVQAPIRRAQGDEFSGAAAYHAPAMDFEDYSQEEMYYSVGMRILHNDFGRGVVRKVEGSGENLRVTVIFDGGGERKFLAHFAPMRPL